MRNASCFITSAYYEYAVSRGTAAFDKHSRSHGRQNLHFIEHDFGTHGFCPHCNDCWPTYGLL